MPDANEPLRVGNEKQEQLKWLMEGPIVPVAVSRMVEERLERRALRKMQESALGVPKVLPSSIDTLQRPNHRPSTAQRAYLAAVLAQKEASIADLDEDVLDLQLKMNSLMKQMRTLGDLRSREQDEADSFGSLLAPVRLLSPELLTRVFKYALPARPHPRRVSSPLGLSHVCSAWRNTIMASSAFWNKLSIQMDVDSGNRDIIASWYSRASSTAPLFLSLSFATEVDLPRRMYLSMVNFSHRLTELRISGDYFYFSEFLCLPGNTLPVLETLFLACAVLNKDDSGPERVFEPFQYSEILPSQITVLKTPPDCALSHSDSHPLASRSGRIFLRFHGAQLPISTYKGQ
ncbi:hypothetical protein D9615_009663 [Tricholomella constricta]|uniref:F-box domain-containing protein n=1 Tax=Tricholomella constricta TaxID=117010 RepID=A0A8H5LVS9_9AGAR|nr:hypothetical protein D9615_009663 [Tricholomella constricta]